MKLLNQSIKYLSSSILLIITLWAVVFYLNMLQEIKDSIDEGLENHKRIVIQNAKKDPSILTKKYFDESFFTIEEISSEKALSITDIYRDTILYMQDFDDEEPELEPVRMLTSAFQIHNKYYLLNIANSMVEEDDLVKELLFDTIWLYLLLVFSTIFINNVVLKKLWDPFYNLLHQLKTYKLESSQKLPSVNTQTKEFLDLQQGINDLLVQNRTVFEQQKEFIGNASHELQTPLAIITSKLELLLEKEQLNTEQANTISDVFQTVQRLIQLNKSLLLLSKIDNKHFFNNVSVNINKVVKESLEQLSDFSTYKNINITFNQNAILRSNMDSSLARILITNLIKNAILHNVDHGELNILINSTSFEIVNTGINKSLKGDKIFNRFHKSNALSENSGLGLAIIKAITDLYHYQIHYKYENNLHCFKVDFHPVQ